MIVLLVLAVEASLFLMASLGTVRNVESSGRRFLSPDLSLLIFLIGRGVPSVEESLYQVVILGAVLHVGGYGARGIVGHFKGDL
ncbi:MAG: hypothetical protein DRN40_04505 [Thermoplasmata archaeon]|nr:MAG: hypothetical protein DRN40_04505 [Thermoplasmata archaeon]